MPLPCPPFPSIIILSFLHQPKRPALPRMSRACHHLHESTTGFTCLDGYSDPRLNRCFLNSFLVPSFLALQINSTALVQCNFHSLSGAAQGKRRRARLRGARLSALLMVGRALTVADQIRLPTHTHRAVRRPSGAKGFNSECDRSSVGAEFPSLLFMSRIYPLMGISRCSREYHMADSPSLGVRTVRHHTPSMEHGANQALALLYGGCEIGIIGRGERKRFRLRTGSSSLPWPSLHQPAHTAYTHNTAYTRTEPHSSKPPTRPQSAFSLSFHIHPFFHPSTYIITLTSTNTSTSS